MTARSLLSLVLPLGICAAGCASESSSDVHQQQGGRPAANGKCPTSIASSADANNQVNVLDGAAVSGDYSGPDGEGQFSSVCIQLGIHPQALQVMLRGKKPLDGVSYEIGLDEQAAAILRYAEDNDGSRVWIGSAGTVSITTAAADTVGFAFDSVLLVPDDTKPNNVATGQLTVTGAARPIDVLGFQP